jgi:hypothetical protein
MKSKQPATAKTSCKTCAFATYIDDTQVGCSAGRLPKFSKQGVVVEARDNDKEFFLIERLCNLHRTPLWKHYQDDDKLALATKEIDTKIGVVIYDLGDGKATVDDINTLESLLDIQDYDLNNIKVIITTYHKDEETTVKYIQMINKLLEAGIKAELICNSRIAGSGQDMVDLLAFKEVQKYQYIIKADRGCEIPSTMFRDINATINQDLDRIIYFRGGDGVSAIPMGIINGSYLDYNNYHKLESAIADIALKNGAYKNVGE